jgi:hypothetical protein
MTLPIQTGSLPPDIEYFLDCSVECLSLDSGARIALLVYGDRKLITETVESAPIPHGPYHKHNAPTCRILASYASDLIAQLGAPERTGAYMVGRDHLCGEMARLAEWFSECAIVDSHEGGMLEAFCKRKMTWRESMKRDARGWKRTMRRLRSPSFIRNFIPTIKESGFLRALWQEHIRQRQTEAVSLDEAGRGYDAFMEAYKEHRARLRARNEEGMRRILTEGRDLDPGSIVKVKPGFKSKALRERRERRKVVRKAAATAINIVGRDAVSAFAAGKPVHLEGESTILEVSKKTSVFASGHGSLDVNLLDKRREKLAELCVYIDRTPALDQLAGFALAMQAGEELEILDTANVITRTEKGRDHPLLAGRRSMLGNLDPGEWQTPPARTVMWDRHGLQQARNKDYWNETRDIWKDTLATFVFHRDWKRVRSEITPETMTYDWQADR